MMEYLIFQEALLSSLQEAKAAYEKGNTMDIENGGEDFSFDEAYKTVFNYVIENKQVDYFSMKDAPMKEFITNTLELAFSGIVPRDLDCLYGVEKMDVSKDFAKKSFLLVMSNSILAWRKSSIGR